MNGDLGVVAHSDLSFQERQPPPLRPGRPGSPFQERISIYWKNETAASAIGRSAQLATLE
jgi:hypothetical protein